MVDERDTVEPDDTEDAEDTTLQEPGDDTENDQVGDSDPPGAEHLGDPGKRALDAMKRERKAARDEAEALRSKLKEYEDANKSEAQRMQESLEEHRTRATRAEGALRKLEVAFDRAPDGASVAQIRAVAKRMQGATDDDLESDADELFALLAPKAPVAPKVAGRPSERMPRGGGDPEEPVEVTDPKKLAAMVPRTR